MVAAEEHLSAGTFRLQNGGVCCSAGTTERRGQQPTGLPVPAHATAGSATRLPTALSGLQGDGEPERAACRPARVRIESAVDRPSTTTDCRPPARPSSSTGEGLRDRTRSHGARIEAEHFPAVTVMRDPALGVNKRFPQATVAEGRGLVERPVRPPGKILQQLGEALPGSACAPSAIPPHCTRVAATRWEVAGRESRHRAADVTCVRSGAAPLVATPERKTIARTRGTAGAADRAASRDRGAV